MAATTIHFLRRGLGIAVVLLIAAISQAVDWHRVADSNLDIVQYTAPSGWKSADQAGKPARTFTSPDSGAWQQAVILIFVAQQQEGFDLHTAFDASMKQVSGNGKSVKAGAVTSGKTRQGYATLSQTVETEAAAGGHMHVRMVAAKVQNRMAGLAYFSNNEAMFDKHQPDMDALLNSVSFNLTVPPPANVKAEMEALEKQKQELLAKVAEIEARQRELAATAGVPIVAPAENAHIAPADAPEKALAIAIERFAKEADGRRKPHTVVGDIIMLDGKPIPNVASYSVEVWGTTIAAERTRYGLEVDKNGHFEQQIPDGLYQVRASCIVNLGGRHVPVDLMAIGGTRIGVDQTSAGGIVKDFRLVIGGLKPGAEPKDADAYFGGVLSVNGPPYTVTTGSFSTRHPGSKVQVTFTPKGLLADGTRCEPFTLDVDSTLLNYSNRLRSIPLGTYAVTATLVSADGGKRPMPCARTLTGDYGDSVEVFWECDRNNQQQRNDALIYLRD